MSNISNSITLVLESLGYSSSAISSVLKTTKSSRPEPTSVYLETRLDGSEVIDVTTCHHFSQNWSESNLDSDLLDSLSTLPKEYRPTHIWREYDNAHMQIQCPGIHLTPYNDTLDALLALYKLLFNNHESPPLCDLELINSTAKVRHLSKLVRSEKAHLKMHVKTTTAQLNQILFSLGWPGDYAQLESVLSRLEDLEPAILQHCVYVDLAFLGDELSPRLGLYLSNKEYPQLSNRQMYAAFIELAAKFPHDENSHTTFVNLLKDKKNTKFVCDYKIMLDNNLEQKAYFCFQKDKQAEVAAFADLLKSAL
ncbi:hypothetical protein N473_02470 [Pseudoalteromonas luteoviolacea CPMOR-1]|uniref:Uncharacterized protein n=1 Tax=Pseudoalteromonas luteoviolacea CPMOR-1 TaxID=1365248 RepID=A0A161Y096_9GAMM|nr:hypothetical protein [Pseudoalteromonas luteoviolacea]KZN59796.1 hypothetical protein N473_02470 [Pseudoalteromonas luteoviolacea CPMOR-1]